MSFIELGAARPPIFIFGTENSLNSARAQELKKLLESMKQSFLICATPQGLKKNFEKQKVNKFLLILMVQDKLPPPLTGWKAIISSLKVPATYVIISAHPILESVKNDLKAELVIEGNAPLELLKQYLTPLPAAMAPGMSTVMPIEGFPLPSSSEKKKITPPAPPPAPTAKAAITATVIDDASQELDAPDLLDGKLENLDMGAPKWQTWVMCLI